MIAHTGISFPSVHYIRKLKGNEEIARRGRGIAARSLRSLRSVRYVSPCAYAHVLPLPLPHERSERSEREGAPPPLSAIYSFTLAANGEVNGSERGETYV